MDFTSNTTAQEVLQDLQSDPIVVALIEKIAKKSNNDKNELTQDIAGLFSARMNYVWRKSMTDEEAEMEGLTDVSEGDVATALKSFKEKYKLDDKYIEHIEKQICEHIDESTIERDNDGKKHSKFKNMRDKYYLLKIILLPITIGLAIFDAFTDFPMFSGSIDLPGFDCALG